MTLKLSSTSVNTTLRDAAATGTILDADRPIIASLDDEYALEGSLVQRFAIRLAAPALTTWRSVTRPRTAPPSPARTTPRWRERRRSR